MNESRLTDRFSVCWVAALLFAVALLLSRSVLAQDGDRPAYLLVNNAWAQLVVPADAGALTLQALFGDELSAEGYDNWWVVYTFNATTQGYEKLGLASQLAEGQGFWIIQNSGRDVALYLPNNMQPARTVQSSACVNGGACAELPLMVRGSAPSWNMVGAPFSGSVPVSDIRVTDQSGCGAGCTLSEAAAPGLSSAMLWHYDSRSRRYVEKNAGSVVAQGQGFWIDAAGLVADVKLLIPPPTIGTSAFGTNEATSRFLSRATFGATASDIERLSGSSVSDWIRGELNQPVSRYLDAVLQELREPGAADPSGEPTFQGRTTPNFVFWRYAIGAPDQLRQRMVYALSQILVISNADNTLLFDRPTSVAAYQDILARHALGNYRDLLEEITYSTAMGEYLTYMQNRKADGNGRMPDENFAREVMQLFSIGLIELDMDGQPRTRDGEPIETYGNSDVSGLARVFTGMSFALDAFEPGFVPAGSAALTSPMVFFPEYHETGEKQFLGTTIPAGTSGEASVRMALDALVAHPNTPPFISRQLIQRFVSSDPSPAYVRRVATAFATGRFTLPDGGIVGAGRRGDLAATIAAILLDREALAEPGADRQSGKLREPVLRFTHWARAFGARSLTARHLPVLWNTGGADALSQSPFRSPSVFNFYRPGYVAPGTETGAAGLTVPELQIVNASSVPGFVNFIRGFVFADEQGNADPDVAMSFVPNYSEEAMLADEPDALVARLNLVLAAGNLRPPTKQRIAEFVDLLPLSDPQQPDYDGRTLRAMHAVLMVMTSPEYTVQF